MEEEGGKDNSRSGNVDSGKTYLREQKVSKRPKTETPKDPKGRSNKLFALVKYVDSPLASVELKSVNTRSHMSALGWVKINSMGSVS